MSAHERILHCLSNCCRVTSTGDAVVSSQELRSVPTVLGVREKVFTKRLTDNIAKFELRQGEYAAQAINIVLAAMDVIINEDSWLPALRSQLGAPLQAP